MVHTISSCFPSLQQATFNPGLTWGASILTISGSPISASFGSVSFEESSGNEQAP
jgi:hypothetical protein